MHKLCIESDMNGKFSAFLDTLHYCCDIPISIKVVYLKESRVKLATQGSKDAIKRLCFLVNQR